MSTGRHVDRGPAKPAGPVAVFVDGSGQRTRWVQWGFRLAILLGIAALALTIVSLLGGVALPGLTRPVTLPSGEPAHPRASAPPALADPTKATSSAPGVRSSGSSGAPGAAAVTTPRTSVPASATRATPTARPTAPASSVAPSTGSRRTTPAPASSAAATTPAARPSASPTARPTATPSHTRTVGATPTTHAGSTHAAPPTHPGGRPSSSTTT